MHVRVISNEDVENSFPPVKTSSDSSCNSSNWEIDFRKNLILAEEFLSTISLWLFPSLGDQT